MAPMKQTTPPILLLAGGKQMRKGRPEPLLRTLFAGVGQPRPTVAYIGAASDDDPDFFTWIADYLQRAGAGPVRLAKLAAPRARLAKAEDVLRESTLIFISGGDVETGMQVLERSGMIPLLHELHQAGRGFFGVSAGSIMLAQRWVRWSDPKDDASAALFPCLGLAPVCCDTHAEDDDWVELQALVNLGGTELAYGIPAGGALAVDVAGGVVAMGRPAAQYAPGPNGAVRLDDLDPGVAPFGT
jgi:peptidase E